FKKGAPLTGGADAPTRTTRLVPGDLVQIHFQLKDHYFRLVPKVNVAPVRPSMWKDAFVGLLALALLVTGAITALYLVLTPPAEEPPKEPPRVAQIEVLEPKQPPPPPAPPREEPPEEKKHEEPKVSKTEQESGGEAAAPKFKAEKPTKKNTSG